MSYDCKVIKIPAQELENLHEKLFQNAPKVESAAKAGKADQFSREAFEQIKSDRKPGLVMDAATIRAGLESRHRALYIKAGWIRDPYITLGLAEYYYLTRTQLNTNDPREAEDPYHLGFGDKCILGGEVRAYRSKDLIEWESLGTIFSTEDFYQANAGKKARELLGHPKSIGLAIVGH